MNRFVSSRIAACIAVLTAAPSAFAVEVGTPAPDFEVPVARAEILKLKDFKGETLKLSQFKGQHVVLEWLNYECPFVKKHYGSKNMQALQKKYTAKGVVWLSVISSAEDAQGYVKKEDLAKANAEKEGNASAILIDADGTIGHLYGAQTTPHMFVIDPKGKIVYAGAIDDKKSTDVADVKIATNYVAQALDASLQGKPVKVAFKVPYGCGVKYK